MSESTADNDRTANAPQEQDLLRTMIDSMPDYIFFKDAASRFILNNKAHLAILRVADQHDLIGKTDFDIFPKDLAARYFADEQLVLQTGKPITGREEPARDPNGKEIWLSTSKVAVHNAAGKIVGLVGISRDITERKHFEAELRKAKDELEIRVEERTADLKTANEGLATRLSQLNFLNTASSRLTQIIHLSELGPAIVDTFISRFDKAEAVLCLRTGGEFLYQHGTKAFAQPAARASAERLLNEYPLLDLHHTLIIEDRTIAGRFSSIEWPGLDSFLCALIIPLLSDNKVIGSLLLFTEKGFFSTHDSELPVLDTQATHAASCLSNAIYYEELGKRARLQGEFDAARRIQQRFTPDDVPSISRVKAKGFYQPANEVSGDYLDYFQTDEGNWVFVVADVCGKGVPAALFMVMLRSAVRLLGRTARSARTLLCEVNDAMAYILDEKAFVTALCLIINKEGTVMSYSRAGHPLLIRQAGPGKKPEAIKCKGLALGLTPDPVMFADMLGEEIIPLEKGNRFIMYTDGLTEATNSSAVEYGAKRLHEVMERQQDDSPESLIDAIIANVGTFLDGTPSHDDLTILALAVGE